MAAYLPEGDRLVFIASNGGQPNHPSWYLNLRAGPSMSVQVEDQTRAMNAQTIEREE